MQDSHSLSLSFSPPYHLLSLSWIKQIGVLQMLRATASRNTEFTSHNSAGKIQLLSASGHQERVTEMANSVST